jgi:hypothetical protein
MSCYSIFIDPPGKVSGTDMQWLKDKYAATSVAHRLYMVSIVLVFLSLLLSRSWGTAALDVTSMIAAGFMIAGFIMWCLPVARWMRLKWHKPLYKAPIVLLHLLALLVATGLSRFAVSEALGLPPQSFDLTVGLLALLFYIPAWMAVVAFLLFLGGLLLLAVTGVAVVVFAAIQTGASFLKIFGVNYSPQFNPAMALFHSGGAIAAGMVLVACYSFFTDSYQPWVLSAIRTTAVIADFHPAPNYPGARPGERIHPLDNGYTAYAQEQPDHSIVIGVRTQENSAHDQPLGDPIPSPGQVMKPLFERLSVPVEPGKAS